MWFPIQIYSIHSFLYFYHLFNVFIYLFNVWNYFRVHIWWLCSSYKSNSTLYFFVDFLRVFNFLVYIFKIFMMNSCSFDFIYGQSLKLFKVYYSKKKKKTALFVPTSCLQALTSSGPLGLNFGLRIFLDDSGTVNYGLQTKVNSDWWVRNSQMKCFRIFLFFLFQNSIQIKVQDTQVSFVGMDFLVCPLWGSSIRVLFLNRACQSDFLPCLDPRLRLLTSMLYTVKTKFLHKDHWQKHTRRERCFLMSSCLFSFSLLSALLGFLNILF